ALEAGADVQVAAVFGDHADGVGQQVEHIGKRGQGWIHRWTGCRLGTVANSMSESARAGRNESRLKDPRGRVEPNVAVAGRQAGIAVDERAGGPCRVHASGYQEG